MKEYMFVNQIEAFTEYLSTINEIDHQSKLNNIFVWIMNKYPNLEAKIAWNQPMFTDHGTFIIGFSVSKSHIAIAPEKAGIIHFSNEIRNAGYHQTSMLFKIKWSDEIDYSLLERIILYNITDKLNCNTFWR